LSLEQQANLERNISNEEIKSGVWYCGTNKSPGPDGFTFEFFCRYWKLLEHDNVATVKEFLHQHKKFKAMVFKVDFEKVFDSIQEDYLQDILDMFGFGDKWRGWINCCLNSAMGSVFVNGSPTLEFQFHKGLLSGIPIDSSLTLSHLFFADDAIFVVKVGGAMSRINYWDDVVAKVPSRLSKWKLKTISIAIYGKDDALNSPSSLSKRSLWLDIIREVTVLGTKGNNLFDLIRKKVRSFDATGEFSVKSVCQLIDDSILPKEEVATRY
ncbi:RNA-directed DNA polymerase, eukaryota, partial [Tanacetum coccineum]